MDTEVLHYDRPTIFMHWMTLGLVVTLWALAQVIDLFPNPARIHVRSLHIVFGVILLLTLAVRLAWRATRGRRLPGFGPAPVRAASAAVHGVLYLLLAAMVGLGVWLEYLRGDSIFTLFRLTTRDPATDALRHQVGDLHGLVAYLILGLGGLHGAVALWHHFRLKDGLLWRMLPCVPCDAVNTGTDT